VLSTRWQGQNHGRPKERGAGGQAEGVTSGKRNKHVEPTPELAGEQEIVRALCCRQLNNICAIQNTLSLRLSIGRPLALVSSHSCEHTRQRRNGGLICYTLP
jgi:hypothetical protein